MTTIFHPYDVKKDIQVRGRLDFHRRSRLQDVDRVFVSEITNVIRLTDTEKLFHIRIVDPAEHTLEQLVLRDAKYQPRVVTDEVRAEFVPDVVISLDQVW